MKAIILCLAILTLTTSAYAKQLKASWYSRADLIRDGQDKRTHFIMANGKEFKDEGFTCASVDYKLGTILKINAGGKSVIVQVTDRCNKRFKGKRVDLSKGAFSKVANLSQGIVQVEVEVLK